MMAKILAPRKADLVCFAKKDRCGPRRACVSCAESSRMRGTPP